MASCTRSRALTGPLAAAIVNRYAGYSLAAPSDRVVKTVVAGYAWPADTRAILKSSRVWFGAHQQVGFFFCWACWQLGS